MGIVVWSVVAIATLFLLARTRPGLALATGVGAAVLVVVVVLVVPIFLDGPSDDQEVVSQSVTLPGQSEQDRTQQTIVLDRDREQPVPATQTPEPAKKQPVAGSPALRP